MEKIMPELFRLGLTTVAAMEGGKMNMDFSPGQGFGIHI